MQHWNIGQDSLNLYVNLSMPINNFVFIKMHDHFKSSLVFTLIISDVIKNKQILRETWEENIIEEYYENTRDNLNFIKLERNYSLVPGKYKVFINIQDQDTKANKNIFQEINLSSVKYISPPLVFIKDNLGKFIQINQTDETSDTLWVRTQLNIPNDRKDELNYYIQNTTADIDSGQIMINENSIDNIFYLSIPFINYKKGKYTIKLNFMDEKQSVSFMYGIKIDQFWTNDINQIVDVMKYIFSNSEYKVLKQKSESEQWNLIDDYWLKKDPTPETSRNELLEEFIDRVMYANKTFALYSYGYKSDRGRIYIIHGTPKSIEDYYNDNMNTQFQKWIYESRKEFIFIDRTSSGDYTLYEERY